MGLTAAESSPGSAGDAALAGRQGSDLNGAGQCSDGTTPSRSPFCGHRSCPQCQHHESQQWIGTARSQVATCAVFPDHLTVPAELRPLEIWLASAHRPTYLFAEKQLATLIHLARRDRETQGADRCHMLYWHTHNANSIFLHTVHLIVLAGAGESAMRQEWRTKADTVLFHAANLARSFRAKVV